MIFVTKTITIDDSEIELHFIRSSGPGGQNVNKVASAVQLRFNAAGSVSLSPDVRQRLAKVAGRRMTKEGIIVIEARQYRTQEQNREAAIARLVALIQKAAVQPRTRRKTFPGRVARERRLETKHRRSAVKRDRSFRGEQQ
jgi:ribosome-associated protein